MSAILRQLAWLTFAAWLSWFVLLRESGTRDAPRTLQVRTAVLDLTPLVEAPLVEAPPAEAPPMEQTEPAAAPPPPPSLDPGRAGALAAGALLAQQEAEDGDGSPLPYSAEPVPPDAGPPPPQKGGAARLAEEERHAAEEPAAAASSADAGESTAASEHELGTPEGADAIGAASARDDAPLAPSAAPGAERVEPARGGRPVAQLMADPALVSQARDEFEHGQAKGFATVLLATPEDQVAIARFFGEELVLVPRRALDASDPESRWFRLTHDDAPRVEAVRGASPLERHRQYRDLFDYEYGRLPAPLRELRRTVLGRGEVYLFAALLSPEEWGLIIARRREALATVERELDDVRRFVMRYVRDPAGGFDLRVEEIVFADGTRTPLALTGSGG